MSATAIGLTALLKKQKALQDEAQRAKAQETTMPASKNPGRVSTATMFTKKPNTKPEPTKNNVVEALSGGKQVASTTPFIKPNNPYKKGTKNYDDFNRR
jgi:hypothetical protein